MPPSTAIEAPFTLLARSDARKATTAANSCGVPMQPAGIWRVQSAKMASGGVPVRAAIVAASPSCRAARV